MWKTNQTGKPCVAVITNHDDDLFCMRLELLQALLNEGYSLLVSCPDGPKLDLMKRKYGLKRGVDFVYDNPEIDRRGMSPRKDWKLLRHYYRLLKEHRPAVVLTFSAKPNVYAGLAAKALGIPAISNLSGLGSVMSKTGLKQFLILAAFRPAFRASFCVMVQNGANMRFAKEHRLIHGTCRQLSGSGVSLERFPLQEYPDGGNGTDGQVVVFNYMGRIMKEKGIDTYLEVARRIRSRHPATEFNVIGFIEPTESHYHGILADLQEQGIVVYRGEQESVLPWIARSHALIHPSVYGEGISNVLIESASCGRPVLTTDHDGCRETVDHGESGFIYNPDRPEELEALVEHFLTGMTNRERMLMGLAGHRKAAREFDRKKIVKEYMRLIRSLTGENEGSRKGEKAEGRVMQS